LQTIDKSTKLDYRHIQAIRPETAETIFSIQQIVLLVLILTQVAVSCIIWGFAIVSVVTITVITVFYALIVYLKIFLGIYSLSQDEAKENTNQEGLLDTHGILPKVTIFGPQYKEGKVVARWVKKMSEINYPCDKLEVIHLIRKDDTNTLNALYNITLPENFRIEYLEPPDYGSKPAALNVGLDTATGEYYVIYDAENGPDPNQIREMVATILDSPEDVVAVQAIPVVSNWKTKRWWQKIPAKLLAMEYASNYSLFHSSLTRLGLITPLPGNSVLFRTEAVRAVGKYDRHNRTEDAQLAVALALRGWKVASIDSETTEEAPYSFTAWTNQRARWVHGFMQTWLVFMRNPFRIYRELGATNFLVFNLIVGGTVFVQVINPILWTLTITYWTTGSNFIREIYPAPVLYMGVFTTIIGTFGVSFYALLIGVMKREMYSNCLLAFAAPLHAIMLSAATYQACFDLFRKAGWHHTLHEDEDVGLHEEAISAVVSIDSVAGR
jgi:glycosyltransferase XagB